VELGHKIVELSALSDLDRGVTVNVGVVQGGTYPYVVAEQATARVDCRILTQKDGDNLMRAFDRIVGSRHVDGVQVRWEGNFHRPAMDKTPENARLLELVLEIARELGLGISEGPLRGGASDGNLVSDMGIPTLCGMGPEGYGAHSADEYVLIDSIFDRAKLLAQCLHRFTA
jgi:glutamate carboxypeptidase